MQYKAVITAVVCAIASLTAQADTMTQEHVATMNKMLQAGVGNETPSGITTSLIYQFEAPTLTLITETKSKRNSPDGITEADLNDSGNMGCENGYKQMISRIDNLEEVVTRATVYYPDGTSMVNTYTCSN